MRALLAQLVQVSVHLVVLLRAYSVFPLANPKVSVRQIILVFEEFLAHPSKLPSQIRQDS